MTSSRASVCQLWRLVCLLLGVMACAGSRAEVPRPVFVLNSQDATISVIDPGSYTEVRRIPTGKEPRHLYLTPDEKSLIVANSMGNSLTFIDPITGVVQRTLRDIIEPYHLRFARHEVVRDGGEPAPPLKLMKRIEAPRTPSHLSIDSRSTVVYASLQDSDELLAIDLATQTPRWKVTVGKMPADVHLTADDRTLLTGLTGDRFVEA